MSTPPPFCATRARDRSDPLLGTALHVRRFLLVEHHGPWPFHALDALDRDTADRLVDTTRSVGARTLLIRRPGRRSRDVPERTWAVADVGAGRITWGTWSEPADLDRARAALTQESHGWSGDPAILVCAHGRHDRCCAVRGRPVAASLAVSHGDLVWECSHVGGDRFAANVVVLPDGTFYGGMDDGDAATVITRHLDGEVDPLRLRGSSAFAPVVQAAVVGAHRSHGPAGARDLELERVEDLGDQRWRVHLVGHDPLPSRLAVDVGTRQLAAAVLTCEAPRATSARTFVVEDVRVGRS